MSNTIRVNVSGGGKTNKRNINVRFKSRSDSKPFEAFYHEPNLLGAKLTALHMAGLAALLIKRVQRLLFHDR